MAGAAAARSAAITAGPLGEWRSALDKAARPSPAHVVRGMFITCVERAKGSDLVHLARTASPIERHGGGILEHVRKRFGMERTQDLNGTVWTILRRSFGFLSAEALNSMVRIEGGGHIFG